MKDFKIPNGYFHLLNTYLIEQQLSEAVLKQLENQDKEIFNNVLKLPIAEQSSHHFFFKLLEATQQYAPPNFIFEMVKYVQPEHFGVLGYMATRSASVAEALQYIIRFSRLVIDGDEIVPMQIHQHEEYLALTWPFIDGQYNLINEVTNAMIIELGRKILPETQFPLSQVGFAHQALIPIYYYQKFYGCTLAFNQSEYRLYLRIDSLKLKPQQADPSLMQLLIRQAEDAIASKPKHASLDQQLHLIVAEYLRLKHHVPKIEELASELHLSVRTLQRQLSILNTSFKQIIETERMLRCDKLLNTEESLSEITVKLGYSDQSALARAYKAFHGQTLLQRKKQLRAVNTIKKLNER